MMKRLISCLLAFALLLGLCGNVFATEPVPAMSQKVTARTQTSVTVQLTVPGGSGSGNGRLIYSFPESLTLRGAKSLVGAEGISNLTTSDHSVSFAWTCYEDYAAETPVLELTFTGKTGDYNASITLPEQDNAVIPVIVSINAPYRYVDVTDERVWYFSYVYEAYDAGLMLGVGNDRFAPEDNLTRAQMAMLLYRMAGSPAVNGKSTLKDVEAGTWYADAVNWAIASGIVLGYEDGTFRPDRSITREETVTLIVRFADAKKVELKKTVEAKNFTDAASISDYAKDAVRRCAEAGILGGYEDGSFRPQNQITRAEAAKLMVGLNERVNPGESPDLPKPPVIDPDPVDPPKPPVKPAYTVTFVGDQGYAKVDGKKVTSVTLEPGQTWLTFSLYGDKSIGFELDDVRVTSGTLSKNGSAFVLKNIDQDVTVSFSVRDMVLTLKFVSSRSAVITPESVQVPWGALAQEPVAEAEGYEVIGWYTEPTFENRFDFSKPVYESATLYARWGVKHFTVNFWDGEELLSTQQVAYRERVERPTDPKKDGYLFTGWYMDRELTQAYSFLTATVSDLDLYAMWRVDDRADYVYLGANDTPQYPAYGVCGDDANDGSSMDKAVKTFERAKELLKDSKNPVIILCGKMPITEDTTWSLADLPGGKVVRNTGLTTYLIDVKDGATLTLDHIIIDGGGEMFPDLHEKTNSGMLYLESAAKLVLNEGTIVQNCVRGSTCSAIYGSGNCTVTINPGVIIRNNSGSFTGGVLVGNVIINGGEFYGNTQTGTAVSYACYGSAVAAGTSLVINGGTFTNNHAAVGATVCAYQNGTFEMNGGTISGNTSGAPSAGVSIGYTSTSYTGSGTLTLNGGVIKDNVGDESVGNPQIYVLRGGQLVLNGAKDAVEIGSIYVDDYNGAYGIYAATPLSNVKGGHIDVRYNDIDINTVFLRGYNTYKITAVDIAAYHLQNELAPYFRAELDENGIYKAVPDLNIATAVYLQSSTVKTNPGNDENDGLTPETPVATFDRAKSILAANAKEGDGLNVIYVMGQITIGAGEKVTMSLAGIPNAMVLRYNTNTSIMFRISGSEVVTENIIIDGGSMQFARNRSTSAPFFIEKNGVLTTKSGTVIQNERGSSSGSVISVSSTSGYTATATIEDLTVINASAYSTSTTAYYGMSIFYVTGAGTSKLTLNGGFFSDNDARLVRLAGAGAHQADINGGTFTGNHMDYAGLVFATDNNATTAAVLNINGGTFADNRASYNSTTRGAGAIGYINSTATVRINGGTFTGNTSAAGEKYSGIYVKPSSKSVEGHLYIAKLEGPMTVLASDTSKTVDNAALVLEAALTQNVTLYDQYKVAGTVVARGTESYTLTEADLAKLLPGDEGISFVLNTEDNTIRIQAAEA